MNIVFMGTPMFAVPTLELLYKNNYNIKMVITQPDRPFGRGKKIKKSEVKIKAEELKLNTFQPENIKNKDSVKKIKQCEPDFIVVVAFGQILSEEILNIPKYGCINVHASLLPKLRGAAPINWAIVNGYKKTGVTTMLMDKGLDTGDMLMKEEIIITKHMNSSELHDILKNTGAELLIKTLENIKENKIIPEKQKKEDSSYAYIMKKSLGRINWDDSAENIHNKIRGLYPWPGAFFVYKEENVKVFKSDYYLDKSDETTGKVIKVDDSGLYVKNKDGVLIIKEIQMPNKKRMTIKEYLKGNNFENNIILE